MKQIDISDMIIIYIAKLSAIAQTGKSLGNIVTDRIKTRVAKQLIG